MSRNKKCEKYFNPYKQFYNAWIPNWLLRRKNKEVSLGAKVVYGRLCQHAGKNGDCFPKQKTLAKECGMSVRQISRYLGELKRLELIDIWRYGKKRSNRYKFLEHPWVEYNDVISNRDRNHDRQSVINDKTKKLIKGV